MRISVAAVMVQHEVDAAFGVAEGGAEAAAVAAGLRIEILPRDGNRIRPRFPAVFGT